MSKPAWSPGGFRFRVMMSGKPKLFLVVEGKETDPWFYENVVARSSLPVSSVLVYRVEHATARFGSAPRQGKQAVLALYREFRRANSLVLQSTRTGKKAVAFCVDADHDRITNSLVRSPHVIYTQYADAEAHVFSSVDLQKLIASAASTTTAETAAVVASLGDPWRTIATLWTRWFELCVTSNRAKVGNLRSGAPSSFHAPTKFGNLDPRRVARAEARMKSCFPSTLAYRTARQDGTQRVRSYLRSGRYRHLVKGKWVAEYLVEKADAYARTHGYGRIRNVSQVYTAARALATFDGSDIDYLAGRINRVSKLIDT